MPLRLQYSGWLLTAGLLLTDIAAYSQGTGPGHSPDSILSLPVYIMDSIMLIPAYTTVSVQMPFDYLIHFPQDEDRQNCRRYACLENRRPDAKNHEAFFQLARSLWQMNRLNRAKKLFLRIIQSKEPFYSATQRISSDVPGDTAATLYGYGSYTFSYQHEACLYLCQINLEQKKFREALACLESAVRQYPVSYSC